MSAADHNGGPQAAACVLPALPCLLCPANIPKTSHYTQCQGSVSQVLSVCNDPILFICPSTVWCTDVVFMVFARYLDTSPFAQTAGPLYAKAAAIKAQGEPAHESKAVFDVQLFSDVTGTWWIC